MLTSALTGIRLSLHVLAATIWVGGLLTLAGLVPALRGAGAGVTAIAARAFSRFSWPAYGVLLLTGFWNYGTFNMNQVSSGWKIVVGIKIFVAVLSGVAAYLHSKAKKSASIAAWGGVSGVSAVTALVMGVFLTGS